MDAKVEQFMRRITRLGEFYDGTTFDDAVRHLMYLKQWQDENPNVSMYAEKDLNKLLFLKGFLNAIGRLRRYALPDSSIMPGSEVKKLCDEIVYEENVRYDLRYPDALVTGGAYS
jgi:predicted translin family RNA/ssDNA-binding protein